MDMEKFPFFKSLIGTGNISGGCCTQGHFIHLSPPLLTLITTETVPWVVRAAVRELCGASSTGRAVTQYLR